MNIIFKHGRGMYPVLIGMIMLSLIYFRKTFGMSSNLRSLCSMICLGKRVAFDFDWKAQRWNLIDGFRCDDGRFCSSSVYGDPSNVAINPKTSLLLLVGMMLQTEN
jgi:hypothetical protein